MDNNTCLDENIHHKHDEFFGAKNQSVLEHASQVIAPSIDTKEELKNIFLI